MKWNLKVERNRGVFKFDSEEAGLSAWISSRFGGLSLCDVCGGLEEVELNPTMEVGKIKKRKEKCKSFS